MTTLHHFYFNSIQRAQQTGERYGQALFNTLTQMQPEVAERVRGSSFDPFYMKGPKDNFEKWDKFCTFVEQNWKY